MHSEVIMGIITCKIMSYINKTMNKITIKDIFNSHSNNNNMSINNNLINLVKNIILKSYKIQ